MSEAQKHPIGRNGAVIYPSSVNVPKRIKFLGTYRTWMPKHNFGRPLPVPRIETKTVWAETVEAAQVQLTRWMLASGHALGGLLSCLPMQTEDDTGK